jgi:hypothetical protein
VEVVLISSSVITGRNCGIFQGNILEILEKKSHKRSG